MNKAVLLVIFNRYDNAKLVLDKIRRVKPPRLYIAADGPRENNKDDIINCKKAREIIKEVDWECDVKTLFREQNMQCGPSVSEAITWAFEYEEDLIILEDDCVPEDAFFYFCESLLDYYKNNEKIMSVCSGGAYNNKGYNYYFLSHIGIWGWATWKRAWKYFNFNIENLYSEELIYEKLRNVHDDSNIVNFWMDMYKTTYQGNYKACWSYQWHFSVLANDGLCVFSNDSFVVNIGTPECTKNPKKVKELLDNREYHNIPKNLIHPEIKRSKYVDYIVSRRAGDEYIRKCNNNIVESLHGVIETIIWFVPFRFLRNKLRNFFRKKVPLYK